MFPSYIEQLVYVACVHVVMGTHYIVPEYTQVCMTQARVQGGGPKGPGPPPRN